MFRKYLNQEKVGWFGYFTDGDDVTAFVTLDRRVVFVEEIKGWNSDIKDDPDDWWRTGRAPPKWHPKA